MVKLPLAQRDYVLLPRRWVVERRCGGLARFRRRARADERWPAPLAGWHFRAVAVLMRKRFITFMVQSA